MNVNVWNALLVVALVIVLSGGGYILYTENAAKRAEIAQAKAEEDARLAAQEKKEQERKQAFEDFLNAFLNDVQERAVDYKKARAVLMELDNATNLRTSVYIEENAVLAQSTVASLHAMMDDIITSFEVYDQEAMSLIFEFDGTDGFDGVLSAWESVRDENVERFVMFFESEGDVLARQLDLIKFYATYPDQVEVDVLSGRVNMVDLALQDQLDELRRGVEGALEDQRLFLDGDAEAAQEP